jgi:hypothetical protein
MAVESSNVDNQLPVNFPILPGINATKVVHKKK